MANTETPFSKTLVNKTILNSLQQNSSEIQVIHVWKECRICLEEDSPYRLIQPCLCSSYIHSVCLLKWIETQNQKKIASQSAIPKCQVCLKEYAISLSIQYGLICPKSDMILRQSFLCYLFFILFSLGMVIAQILFLRLEQLQAQFWKENEKLEIVVVLGILVFFILFCALVFRVFLEYFVRKRTQLLLQNLK